jgi:CheY-like chemotaxis protein
MTAHAMKGDRELCIEAGMNDYVTKPIKRELVFEMIEKWVFEKRVWRQPVSRKCLRSTAALPI